MVFKLGFIQSMCHPMSQPSQMRMESGCPTSWWHPIKVGKFQKQYFLPSIFQKNEQKNLPDSGLPLKLSFSS